MPMQTAAAPWHLFGLGWAYRPMIPWDNVTISARARITQANKRLRSLTAGGGRHGMAVSRGLVAQNGRCIRCFASPLTNRASACGMAAQVQIDQPRINGTPLQTPPCLQYTAHASCSKHRSVVPGDASGNVRASVSPLPDLLGLSVISPRHTTHLPLSGSASATRRPSRLCT